MEVFRRILKRNCPKQSTSGYFKEAQPSKIVKYNIVGESPQYLLSNKSLINCIPLLCVTTDLINEINMKQRKFVMDPGEIVILCLVMVSDLQNCFSVLHINTRVITGVLH